MSQFYIDIYILTDRRDLDTSEGFLEKYTDREAIEDQTDGELFILPEGKVRNTIKEIEYICLPAKTVTNAVRIGLDNRGYCFTMYFRSIMQGITNVILSFTQDGKLILGLSVSEYTDDTETRDNYGLAEDLRKKLSAEYGAIDSYFRLEVPPADNEAEFMEEKKIWSRGSV